MTPRQAFSEREDNEYKLTPEQVTIFSTIHRFGMDGGGLPLGSGALIEAAEKLLAEEGSK